MATGRRSGSDLRVEGVTRLGLLSVLLKLQPVTFQRLVVFKGVKEEKLNVHQVHHTLKVKEWRVELVVQRWTDGFSDYKLLLFLAFSLT